MKTIELGNTENLEKLNFIVAKIIGLNPFLFENKCYANQSDTDNSRYSPSTYAIQCLEATPICTVDYCKEDKHYYCLINNTDKESYGMKRQRGATELIARCLALVYSVYGDEVSDDLLS